jgi:hypothetical protein
MPLQFYAFSLRDIGHLKSISLTFTRNNLRWSIQLLLGRPWLDGIGIAGASSLRIRDIRSPELRLGP